MRSRDSLFPVPSRARRLGRALRALFLLAGLVALGTFLDWSTRPTARWAGHAEAIDGDSLRLDGRELRLKGLDAPEYRQTCTDAAGRETECGKRARQALAAMLREGPVDCAEHEKDRFGRGLVTCAIAGRDLGARLVAEGMAVAFGGYEAEEAAARAAQAGIWAGQFERPQDWRRRHPRAP